MVPPKSPGGTKDLKTTTIVMSKHTLAPQNPNNVSTILFFFEFCIYVYILHFLSLTDLRMHIVCLLYM